MLAGTAYSYTVDAIDASPAHNKSAVSSPPATVTTPTVDSTPPSVPQGVGAVANGPTSVTVSWSASSDASGIANYEVYRGGVLLTTVSGSTTSFTDTSVLAGTAYSYTVDAIDASPAHNKSASLITTGHGHNSTEYRWPGRADHHDHDGEQALQRHRRQLRTLPTSSR